MVRYIIKARSQRGDTLTEVMFATAVAALVIVISMAAMNRSFAQTQMAVETTFVRQSIDAEAELLRYARDQYTVDPSGVGGKTWRDVLDLKKNAASSFGTCYNKDPTHSLDLPSKGFFIKDDDLNAIKVDSIQTDFTRPDTFADIGKGIWIEAVRSPPAVAIPYLDLHIRACWEPPFNGPDATLGTIVRLYYENI